MEKTKNTPQLTRRTLLGAALASTTGVLMGTATAQAEVTVPFRKGYARGRFGQIHYRMAQPATATGRPPLLCFHMSPNSGRIYETFLQHMGSDRIAVAPDTPGFGDSDPPGSPPEISDYAAAMGDLIDSLGFGSVDVMGYHTGSETCLELALQRPDQVRRLVLVSAPIFSDAELADHRAHYARDELTADGSHLEKRWQSHLYWAMEGWTREQVAYQFPDSLRRQDIAWWGHNAAFNFPTAEKLASVTQPVLVLNPEDDLHEQSLRAAGLIKQGRIHELPGWGHGFLDLFPEQAAALVRSHLDGEQPS
jgi:pimeloyl-ACP methyl ester carboxylesterase